MYSFKGMFKSAGDLPVKGLCWYMAKLIVRFLYIYGVVDYKHISAVSVNLNIDLDQRMLDSFM